MPSSIIVPQPPRRRHRQKTGTVPVGTLRERKPVKIDTNIGRVQTICVLTKPRRIKGAYGRRQQSEKARGIVFPLLAPPRRLCAKRKSSYHRLFIRHLCIRFNGRKQRFRCTAKTDAHKRGVYIFLFFF